jgi:3-oxoadipate enol-lactonase
MFATINGKKIEFELIGAGPRLLYIGGSVASFYRRPNVFTSALASEFEILAFNHRGIGNSESPDGPYTMVDYTADAVAVIKHVGWDKCHVVGYSFGGMVAQELALNHPDLVESLTLLCTTSGGEGGSSFEFHKLDSISNQERAQIITDYNDIRFRNNDWRVGHFSDYYYSVNEWVEMLEEISANPEGASGRLNLLNARKNHNTFARLKELSVPTLVIACRFDGIAPLEFMKNMCQQINGAVFEELEGGHGFPTVSPKAFLRIKAFLASKRHTQVMVDEIFWLGALAACSLLIMMTG